MGAKRVAYALGLVALAVSLGLPGSALAADPIKIGVLTPLSGSYAPIGKEIKWGADLAVKEINAVGGVLGRQIQLIYEDAEANPAVAVRKAEKLFQEDKVDFLTGTVNSGATLAVGQVAERNSRLIATTVSYATSITGEKCSPNVFRVNANAFMQSNALTAWLAKNVSGKRYLFIGPDYEMGKSTISAFQDGVKRHGGQDVGVIFAPLGAKDYSTYFGRIRAARPDVIMTAMAGNDTVRMLSQMKEYGLLDGKVTLAGAAGAVTQENIAGMNGAAEGFVSAAGYAIDIPTPANKVFVQAFEAAYHTAPDLFAADTYGLFSLLKQAISKAGGTDTAKLRAALEGASWDTPQGKKTMRKGDHQAMMDMFMVKVVGKSIKTVDTVPADEVIGPDRCKRW